jgi:hypothetical protein
MSISSSIINGIFQQRIPESPNPQNQDEVIDKKGKTGIQTKSAKIAYALRK